MRLYSLLLGTLLLTGCATSTLNLSDDTLTLTYDKEKLSAKGITVDEKFDRYPELALRQSIIELNDDTLLVYEDVQADITYQFQYSTPKSVEMIFEAKKIKTLYQRNNLYFFQLALKNGKFLNIVAQQSNMQSLTQLYGFSNEQIRKIIEKVSGEKKELNLHEENVVVFEKFEGSYLSRWSTKLIAIDGLMIPDMSTRLN
jgi:hypothetical protein